MDKTKLCRFPEFLRTLVPLFVKKSGICEIIGHRFRYFGRQRLFLSDFRSITDRMSNCFNETGVFKQITDYMSVSSIQELVHEPLGAEPVTKFQTPFIKKDCSLLTAVFYIKKAFA